MFPGIIPPDRHVLVTCSPIRQPQVTDSFILKGFFLKGDKAVETKLRFFLATGCTTNIIRYLNKIKSLAGTMKWNLASWIGSNKKLRAQFRRHWQYPNKQSVLYYGYIQQIRHLYVLAFTLSYKHQWILDAQFHLKVFILYSKHI